MNKKFIHIEGARQHNLKNISLDIMHNQLVTICGPSGSGKSTLAFDIIYAEGQRRYVESLSAYARQFLPQMNKPDVDKIEGLSPAISLEQQTSSKNPRSTVGTVTEIYDFLRVFFARLGKMHCSICGQAIESQSADEIIADILSIPSGSKFIILAPLIEHQKGTHQELFKKLKAEGFVRVRVNNQIFSIEDCPELEKLKKHNIELVIDRLVLKDGLRGRLADAVELALRYGEGRLIVNMPEDDNKHALADTIYSTKSVCLKCRISLPNLSPQLFSFNSPQGACTRCVGLGSVDYFEPLLITPNKGLALKNGALLPWANPKVFARHSEALEALGKRWKFSISTPLIKFSENALNALFYGEDEQGQAYDNSQGLRRNWMGGNVALNAKGDYNSDAFNKADEEKNNVKIDNKRWPGVITLLENAMQYGDVWREMLSRFRQSMDCPTCKGARLNPEALAVKVDDLNIFGFCSLSVTKAIPWLQGCNFTDKQKIIAEPLLKELEHKFSFMKNVGLEYISLTRSMSTLSGGEAQRIRLASQLGSGLVGVTYVLDEPSIGLHPKDNERLINTLRNLQRRGNTVIVVEHDEATICEADTVIELGPGSGSQGGELIFNGTVKKLLGSAQTLTAKYLRGDLSIALPEKRRKSLKKIIVKNITTHNLKNIDCHIPLGLLNCVTGVSGSGKSSLVIDTIYKHLALSKGLRVNQPGTIGSISGHESIERIVSIDQNPIGRTPRSNPATYTKTFDEIRSIFAMTTDARKKGYKVGRFSFNVAGGRCEACKGDGQIRIEMHFLPDVYIQCDICKGQRYNYETLEVRYKGLNIAEVLNLSVRQARKFFENYPVLERRLAILEDVGLDYLQLGQPATTLSGGEAQRIKISRELGKRSLPNTIYILDEPTTGLHMHEVGKLIKILNQLIEKGATVIVIEHNTDVIMSSDNVIDLGPGGGESGGYIISQGTPEAIIADPNSVTGSFLSRKNKNKKK